MAFSEYMNFIKKNRVLRIIYLYRLHLLANRAVIWHQIWGSLHKMTCSTPCSPNLTPQRERSRASPTKTVPSVSIRSRKYVGSSCKTSKDVSQVCMYVCSRWIMCAQWGWNYLIWKKFQPLCTKIVVFWEGHKNLNLIFGTTYLGKSKLRVMF